MKPSHWRMTSATIIVRVLAETKGKSEKEIRKALHDAYPFGERAMYPYKIWLNEIQRRTGQVEGKNKKRLEQAGQMKLLEWEQLHGKREA